MILARLSRAVREQNWFAVALEFVIVVAGVVIGFQITAWNDERADREALRLAFERFEDENSANLHTLAETGSELDIAQSIVSGAIDTLRQCRTGPDAEAAIVAGLNQARITFGIRFRTSALRELTERPALLSQQSDEQRRLLQRLVYDLDFLANEATAMEMLPFASPIWHLDDLTVTDSEPVTFIYRGYELTRPSRDLVLAVPVEDACRKPDLVAELSEWEEMQAALGAVLDIAVAKLEAAQNSLVDHSHEPAP